MTQEEQDEIVARCTSRGCKPFPCRGHPCLTHAHMRVATVTEIENQIYNKQPNAPCGTSLCSALACVFCLCGGWCVWWCAKEKEVIKCEADRRQLRENAEWFLRGKHMTNTDGSQRRLHVHKLKYVTRYTLVVDAPAGSSVDVWLRLDNDKLHDYA